MLCLMRPLAGAVVAVLALAPTLGCSDPCVQLQERICNCEADTNSRRACISDRITNQQGQVEVSDEDKAFCAEKLETCTCAALDVNDPDNLCGFALDTGDAE